MGDCPSCSAASPPDRGSAGRCFILEVLSAFLERGDLAGLIRRSLAHFGQLFIGRDGYATVAPEKKAASSTAYSAFLVLALARSELPDEVERLTRLADGIVGQQRQDGSHKVFFDDAPDSGEELYPAEAMLASRSPPPDRRYALPRQRRTRLLALQARLLRPRALDPHLLVFFANWQSQAGLPVLRRTWSVSTATSVLPALASTRTNSWHTWVRLSCGPREVSADRLPLRERTCH